MFGVPCGAAGRFAPGDPFSLVQRRAAGPACTELHRGLSLRRAVAERVYDLLVLNGSGCTHEVVEQAEAQKQSLVGLGLDHDRPEGHHLTPEWLQRYPVRLQAVPKTAQDWLAVSDR